MKLLGFSKKQAFPVLKQLVKTFNNNWEPIEDECYRALADAILDSQDSQQTPASEQGTQAAYEHSEPHGTTRDDRHSYASAGEDDNETPLVKRPRVGAADFGQDLQPGPRQSTASTQGSLPTSPQTSHRQTRYLTLAQHAADPAIGDAVMSKEPKPEPGTDAARIGSTVQNTCEPQVVPMRNNGVGSSEASFVEVDVASSTNGVVKMSLKCNLDPSKFSISMEEVFKMVEQKCLHSYKVLPPDFSIGKLMSEVCQSVAQLGTMQPDVHSSGGSLHKEAAAPFVKPIACMAAVGIDDNSAGGSSMPESLEPCLQNSIVAWDPEFAQRRTTLDVTDISKGEERVRISVVNEFDSETCPPSFYYIPRNIVFQNACVNISIARIGDEDCCADCSGNCLSASFPCACARATGGFVYTPEGLVKTAFLDECTFINHFPEKHHRFYCKACPLERSKNEASPGPCKGHLVRKFIKECWSKCGCGMQCGNRVIQRGITCRLQVYFTHEGKGWGLRTLEDLPKGAFVCEYAGEVLTSTEMYGRAIQNGRNGKHMKQVHLDADWSSGGVLRDEEALGLDGTFYGNVGRFINHRCYDANLVQIPVEVETPDHHYYHVAFFTTKKVEAFEELTWDYGIDFDDVGGPSKAFGCMCGSRYCRDRRSPRRMGRAAGRN
ncbi:unnamed protein product [Urochloa decumbens]|uniref:SET domain-containing protein n=1 Tax=Urochloa decumbens TaxID=240449 RepID=A0ABC9BIY7_9POAL